MKCTLIFYLGSFLSLLLLLLASLVSVAGILLTSLGTYIQDTFNNYKISYYVLNTFRWINSMLELRNLLAEVQHDRVTSGKIFFQQLSVTLLQLDLESASEHLLFAALPRIILALYDVSFAHLVPGVVQHHLDLLVGGVLAALVQRDPATLVDALLAVEVCGVDADEPLRVRVQLVGVERSNLGRGRAPGSHLLGVRGQASDRRHSLQHFIHR